MQAEIDRELLNEAFEEYKSDIEMQKELKSIKDMSDNIVPYEETRMKKALASKIVNNVNVFRLEKGMKVSIGGKMYKVTKIKNNKRVELKELKD